MTSPERTCDWVLCCTASSVVVRMGRAIISLCSKHLELLIETAATPGIAGVALETPVSGRWQGSVVEKESE